MAHSREEGMGMKYKTSELSGDFLDAAVSMAEGRDGTRRVQASILKKDGTWVPTEVIAEGPPFHPSTSWEHGGPIIERENIMTALLLPDDDNSRNRAV
jgi:hypothetical protein